MKNLLIKMTDAFRQYDMVFKLLLIYMITLPVMKTPNLPFLAQRIQFSEVVFIFLFVLWLKGLIKNRYLPQDAGLNKPFLLFMLFCLLSFFNSTNLFISIAELLGLIYLYVMLILVVDIVDNKRKLDAIIKIWIATSAVVLVLGFIGWCTCIITGETNLFCRWVYHGNFPYLKNMTVYRMHSVFRNPLGLANYLLVSLSFVISDLLLAENKKYRTFLKIMLFFICLAMIVLFSRELLGLMLISLLIYNYFLKKKDIKFKTIRFLSISLMVILFLFITIFCSSFYIRSYKIENFSKETHKELALNIDYAYDAKLSHKIAALEMIKRHPFLGVGLAMYRPYLQQLNNENYFHLKNLVPIYYYSRGSGYFDYLIVNDPHNDILQYLAETGILGGIAFIIFIATFLYLIFTNLKRIDNQYFKVRVFCFSASFIAVLIESIDLDVFKIRHLWFMMALILALIAMYKKKAVR